MSPFSFPHRAGHERNQSFLPSLQSLMNLLASSPASFRALASRSQCMEPLCFFAAGAAVEAGVAVGVGEVLAANALPAANKAAMVRVGSSFMRVSGLALPIAAGTDCDHGHEPALARALRSSQV